MHRRQFLKGAAALGALSLTSGHALADKKETLKLGYLHTLSADSHLWVGDHLGAWKKQGLEIETVEFVTGLGAYQALAGGSIDMVTTGAVISNFPARGQGKAFLINGLETGIAQIWADPAQGIEKLEDLKGKRIATTRGTTAHFFLHEALKTVGLNDIQDTEIVHQRLDQAVTSFVAGSVPAVVLWVPFDLPIRQHRSDAKLLAQSSDFPNATVVDGWSARNGLAESRPDLLRKFIRGWAEANALLTGDPDQAIPILADNYYPQFDAAELRRQYDLVRWHTVDEWLPFYRDGSIVKWLDHVTDFNREVGAIKNPIPASIYFTPEPFLKAFG